MFVRAELILFVVALSLATLAIAFALPTRFARWRIPVTIAACAVAAFAPLLYFPFASTAQVRGAALWEWSAVGGPTIQASYRLDGLGTLAIGIGALFIAAALLATTRMTARHQLLRPTILLGGFVFITLVVTDDLIAGIVVLGALAAVTSFIALLMSPPPAAARLVAYLAAGMQGFVLAALLVSRFGGASFRFDAISPHAVTPGVVLAASIGAALFAGLYPFVPWGYRHEEAGEREVLRGLLTMPVGFGATILLTRVLGITRIDLATLGLPGMISLDVAIAGAALLALFLFVSRRRPAARRRVLFVISIAALLFGYDYLRWSHVVLAAALLSIAYAAAVALALPEQWAITKFDVVLATYWIALATGSPLALAGALVVVAGAGLDAIWGSLWMAPHHAYIATSISSTAMAAGVLAVGLGAFEAPDLATIALATLATLAVLALILADVGRRLSIPAVPTELDISAAVAAFLGTMMLALLLSTPLGDAATRAFGRPLIRADLLPLVAAIVAFATLLVVAARAVRPFVPDLARVARRIDAVVSAADPVPTATSGFRLLSGSATTASAIFALFEERAGVWLALVLITTVLFWAVR
jgi:hypothetical protein